MASEYPTQLDPHAVIRIRIKAHREKLEMGQRDFASFLGYQQSSIAKYESGDRRITDKVAEVLDEKLDTRGEFVTLLAMARALLIEPGARDVLARESDAERIRVFNSSVIPGLLQTEEYALALTRKSRHNDSIDEISELVAARMQRQRLALGKDRPPLYRAVIDEAALARPIGMNQVMHAQLAKLVTYAKNPRVRVQIIPYAAREHGMLGGSLVLLDLPGGPLALVENFRTAQGVELPREVVEYQELYEAVDREALTVMESAELIGEYMKEYAHD